MQMNNKTVHMYMYICTYIHTYTMYIYMYIHTYIQCVYVCTYIHVHTYIQCMYVHVHMYSTNQMQSTCIRQTTIMYMYVPTCVNEFVSLYKLVRVFASVHKQVCFHRANFCESHLPYTCICTVMYIRHVPCI